MIIIAENILVKIPIDNDTAKPLIVPVPNQNRTIAAINVVIFASNIVRNAFLNPALILILGCTLGLYSSLMRSYRNLKYISRQKQST